MNQIARRKTPEEVFLDEAVPAIMDNPDRLQEYVDKAIDKALPDTGLLVSMLSRLAERMRGGQTK